MEEENNNNNKNKDMLKKIIMAVIKKTFKPFLIGAIILVLCICILAAALWLINLLDTKENSLDPKNALASVRNFMNDTTINADGILTSSKNMKEFWEELVNKGNRATAYLNSAEELAKLVQAAQALDFPDTRKNPDEPINWKNIDIESNEIQGIVKFKRALADGNTITMTYVTPSKLQELMNKYMETGKEKDKQEALKHFTLEKTYSASGGTTTGGNPLLQEALTYACSWVGKIPYKSVASGDGNNNERFLPLKAGRASDCSHFIHWVFEHVGLMHKDKFVRSLAWGKGGDNGGCPGTVRIGTDLSNASPGDVLWWHFGDEWKNHVAIYLGNNKMVECSGGKGGVVISDVKQDSGIDQILHFSQFPTDPTGYFDPETMTLHSSLINSNTSGDIAKVSSLNGMVFLGDSILTSIVNHSSILKNEGVTSMHQPGCRPRFFLGEETVGGRRFNWNKEFSRISNPTGFYLLLGQNSCHDKNNRIKEMDRLIQKIKSSYPSAPIYMSSVLYHLDRTGADKRAATAMNEELKVYCASQSNVYYSDILRGYNDNLREMSYDNDHPNKKGSEVLINNIKQNIIGYSSGNTASSSTASTSTSTATYNTRVPASGKYDVTNCFSPETQRIVDAHRNDFNINNFKQKMQQAGGYASYVRSLGGVFAKYIDKIGKKDFKVQNAGEFQEICEYTFGLMTIWGFDYGNDIVHRSWGAKATPEIKAGAFYPHGTDKSYRGSYNNVNELCGDVNNPKMKTNCNTGVNLLLETAGLAKRSQVLADNIKKGAKKIIYNKSELQVGDIMHFYKDSGRTKWHHAAIVGEVDKERNLLTIYDFAGRFLESGGRYKLTCPIDDSKDLGNGYSKYWCGARWFDLDQSVGVANGTTSSNSTSNTTQYQVKVATWNEYTDGVTSNDPDVQSYGPNTTYNMTTTAIPYQQIVSKFKMPFNYIYTMLVYGQEKDFVFDLADLVKNSKIEITVHDNLNETKDIITDTYTDFTKIHARADVDIAYKTESNITNRDPNTNEITNQTIESDHNVSKEGIADGTKSVPYKVVQTTISKNNTLDIALTLADAWYTKYEKTYTYNKPETSHSSYSTKLDDKVNAPYTKTGELGGLDHAVENNALSKVTGGNITEKHVTNVRNKKARFQTSRIKRNNNIDTTTKTSSYIGPPANNSSTMSSVVTPKTGSLNKNNWAELKIHYRPNGVFDSQQGFCLVGDDMMACVLHNWGSENNNKLNLIDANTLEVLDTATGFVGHGNTIAFDPKTEDLIIPGCDGKMNLIHVNRSAKTLENKRKVANPLHTNDYSTIAYNATHDLFVSDGYVFTRDAFYSRGKALRSIYRKKTGGKDYHAGCTSFGNQVYYFFSVAPNYNKNYLLITNIITGKHEETIQDSTAREGQGVAFMSDGTLYTCYGGNPTSLWRTDYNYFYDNNIDKSNITPGASSSNSIAKYNTGGVYTSKYGAVSSVGETPKTGQLNTNNFITLPHKSLPNIQEGFCLIGDNLYAVSMMNNSNGRERSKVYLLDMATFTVCDTVSNLNGHGNSLTYDTVTGDLIYPEKNGTTLIHVDTSAKRFGTPRKVNTPAHDQIAYNKHHDLFITYNCVYTRQQFYANGKAQKVIEHKSPHSGSVPQAQGTYGNHVYFCHSAGNGNYIIVTNIHTGNKEKVIFDNTHREIEELDFTSDGTMYIMYGGGGKNFRKTDYNYFADNEIDKSNVTPVEASNSIAMYNTGGIYIDKSSFEALFNSHIIARSNILNAKEWLFQALEQNSDTKRMVDLTKYLFYRATGIDYGVTTFDFEAYQLEDIGTTNNGGGTTLDITSCSLTKEQFIQLTQSYSAAISKGSGTKVFRDNAGIIYDVCTKNKINPVLCAAQAWQEQNWDDPNTSPYNFWGIAVFNGQNYGKSWANIEQAVQGYCDQINSQLNGKMKSTYQETARKFSTVNSKFKGDMTTIYDVFSAYAYIGKGHTLQEEADYAASYVEKVIKCATQIYGEGVLTGGSMSGGDFLAVAQSVWKKICNGNYTYGGSSIPCTSTVDCSSFISWVIYEYGYSDFKGGQKSTVTFMEENWKSKYGWEEINVGGGQNPYDVIQPGDIFVRDNGSGGRNGHVTLVVRKENGKIYCYDCGGKSNWDNNPNGNTLDKSYMLRDNRKGKIIRVKPKT